MSIPDAVILWLLLSGVGTLIAWPRISRHPLLARLAAANAVGSLLLYNALLPAGTDIRVDLFLTVPLVVAVLVLALKAKPPSDHP
jgi:hypothetical protein